MVLLRLVEVVGSATHQWAEQGDVREAKRKRMLAVPVFLSHYGDGILLCDTNAGNDEQPWNALRAYSLHFDTLQRAVHTIPAIFNLLPIHCKHNSTAHLTLSIPAPAGASCEVTSLLESRDPNQFSIAPMSFFDSVKKSLGIGKDKSTATGGGGCSAFDKFDVTFSEETLGIGIVKYSGSMPHLPAQDANSPERSCPIVTLFESRRQGELKHANFHFTVDP